MNTIPAQEIKRRGIAAVDNLIETGDVHIIKNNQPQYVVLSEVRYRELIEAQDEAYMARVRASLEDLNAGRVRRFTSAQELLNALDEDVA
ncbi:MAG: prevent-host-death protein [Deltaproteobacteria bacterium CG_4_10_14_3_um_filter_60_8]|nr:MAG: prevent-host-death protein [Desulfobacterales bacterium CG2_30_60_27]PIY22546.1 MAG: prevent-host-death protein [Deltaproteobacteria bacterium CG_4_10_14_3_um_filter_60_8]